MKTVKDTDYGIRDKRGHWSPFKKLTINPIFTPFHFSKFLFKFIKDKFIFGLWAIYLLPCLFFAGYF